MKRLTGIVLGVFVGTAVTAAAAQSYVVIDLGTLGGTYSKAWAINNQGQIVGYADLPGSSYYHAYRTGPSRAIVPATDDLGTLGGNYSEARDINSLGQVTGSSTIATGYNRAFRTGPNAAINSATDDLGTLQGGYQSLGNAINDSGQVVGVADTGNFDLYPAHAFRTAPNSTINPATDDLGTLASGNGKYSEAYGINSLGQVVGYADTATSAFPPSRAFRAAPNAAINRNTDDLGTLGGSTSYARGINASGRVVGAASLSGNTGTNAFRTAPNATIAPGDNLGNGGGTGTRGNAINASGITVGHIVTAGGNRAFVYDGVQLVDLNTLIDPGANWVLNEARDINDMGQIVGNGFHNGLSRAFLLTPKALVDIPPDFDGDGDVDATDFAHLEACFTGATVAQGNPACDDTDLDNDGDTDQTDFGLFQKCSSGQDALLDATCWP